MFIFVQLKLKTKQLMTPKTVKTQWATITYRSDGIIHVHYEDMLLSLAEIKTVFYTTRENSPWDIAPIYITGGTFTNQDADARAFSGSEEVMNHCSAIGFLSKTPAEKLLANFFIKFIKPSKPTRFFATEEAAIDWLKQYPTTPNN